MRKQKNIIMTLDQDSILNRKQKNQRKSNDTLDYAKMNDFYSSKDAINECKMYCQRGYAANLINAYEANLEQLLKLPKKNRNNAMKKKYTQDLKKPLTKRNFSNSS